MISGNVKLCTRWAYRRAGHPMPQSGIAWKFMDHISQIFKTLCARLFFLQTFSLLHNELRVAVTLIQRIANQACFQGKQQLTDAVINVQARLKTEFAFDLCK